MLRDCRGKRHRWRRDVGTGRSAVQHCGAERREHDTGERDPSQIRRWTFDLKSKKEEFLEEVVSTTPGILPRMDDRFLSLDYRYAYVTSRDDSRPPDPNLPKGLGGRLNNAMQRLDVRTGEIKQCFAEPVHSLQENMFVPRKGSREEGDGYVMGVASNYAEMLSELHIVDAKKMEQGAVAVVKLPFRLRGGTHVNWYSADELATQEATTI